MALVKRWVITTLLSIGTILVGYTTESAGLEQQKLSPDQAAVHQLVQSYVESFNKGDAVTLASLWSDNAEYVSASGDRLKGRQKIEAFFQKFFAENKGLELQASVSSLRFPAANKAVEVGTATVTRHGESPEVSLYVAEYVKRGGVWKLTSVKEEGCSVAYEHLKELEWLIGEWIDQDENATVETTYQWSRNRSFITGSFTVYIEGKVDLQGTQVIGWDPVAKTIRSWVFDSQGGFGQGTWLRKGNQWIAESTSVLSTGEKASAMNIYTYVDDNTFTLQSLGRQIGAEPAPNIDEVAVIRKQPAKSHPQPGKQTR